MQDKTDTELIADILRAGDGAMFGILIKRYHESVYRRAYSILGDWAEAQDVVQEATVRAYYNLHRLQETEKFSAWFHRIVYSTSMMSLRGSHPELFRSINDQDDVDPIAALEDQHTGTPIEQTLSAEMSVIVLSAIEDLPIKYRLPLTLFHLEGFSYRKVSDLLDIPLGTVQSLVSRAKKKLKPVLHPYASDVFPVLQSAY